MVIDCHESSLFNKSLDSRNDEKDSSFIAEYSAFCSPSANYKIVAEGV
ncbi:hypothetical protein [Helicobacter sp. T3_23-1056]